MSYYLCALALILISCSQESGNNVDPNLNSSASFQQVLEFFDYQGAPLIQNIEYFDQDTSLPVKSISVGEYELTRSILFTDDFFSVLILDNPTNTSINLFYKKKGRLVYEMLEDMHYPDSIHLSKLNDTLLVCQYYWKYDFGSDLSDLRTYYFIGKNTGLFKYSYNCVGDKCGLNIREITSTEKTISVKELDLNTLRILPDTLIRVGSNKNDFLYEPYLIPFEKFTFTRH
jgi:hypothetical protein